MKRLLIVISLLSMAIVTGCATLPSVDVMRSEAETYQLPKAPDSGKAMVYIVRPSSLGGIIRFNVFLDDQEDASEMGYTRASQYIYFNLPPGEHKIYSKAENWAETTVIASIGEVIFLQQEPIIGVIMARNNLYKIEEYLGKYHVKSLSEGTIIKTEK